MAKKKSEDMPPGMPEMLESLGLAITEAEATEQQAIELLFVGMTLANNHRFASTIPLKRQIEIVRALCTHAEAFTQR